MANNSPLSKDFFKKFKNLCLRVFAMMFTPSPSHSSQWHRVRSISPCCCGYEYTPRQDTATTNHKTSPTTSRDEPNIMRTAHKNGFFCGNSYCFPICQVPPVLERMLAPVVALSYHQASTIFLALFFYSIKLNLFFNKSLNCIRLS